MVNELDKCPYEYRCYYQDDLCKTHMNNYLSCVFYHAYKKYEHLVKIENHPKLKYGSYSEIEEDLEE